MCRSRRELSNAYLLPKFGFDTAENEPSQILLIGTRDARSHRSGVGVPGSEERFFRLGSAGAFLGYRRDPPEAKRTLAYPSLPTRRVGGSAAAVQPVGASGKDSADNSVWSQRNPKL